MQSKRVKLRWQWPLVSPRHSTVLPFWGFPQNGRTVEMGLGMRLSNLDAFATCSIRVSARLSTKLAQLHKRLNVCTRLPFAILPHESAQNSYLDSSVRKIWPHPRRYCIAPNYRGAQFSQISRMVLQPRKLCSAQLGKIDLYELEFELYIW